jgi:hypothetical protein
LAAATAIALLPGCGSDGPEHNAGGDHSALEAGAERIDVSSDPAGATYYLLWTSRMPNNNYEVVTRRDGRLGTSYARREVNCTTPMTFCYLGQGDSLAEAKKNVPNPGAMAQVERGSISAQIVEAACRAAARS